MSNSSFHPNPAAALARFTYHSLATEPPESLPPFKKEAVSLFDSGHCILDIFSKLKKGLAFKIAHPRQTFFCEGGLGAMQCPQRGFGGQRPPRQKMCNHSIEGTQQFLEGGSK